MSHSLCLERQFKVKEMRQIKGMSRIGDILKEILEDLGLGKAVRGEEIKEAWGVIVGPLSSRTRALDFKDGVLKVGVKGAALRQDLEMKKYDFIEKFKKMGFKEVEDIRWMNWRKM